MEREAAQSHRAQTLGRWEVSTAAGVAGPLSQPNLQHSPNSSDPLSVQRGQGTDQSLGASEPWVETPLLALGRSRQVTSAGCLHL